MRREPRQFGQEQSRWTLSALLASCDWLRLTSLGGLARLLQRLKIGLKRGRDDLHSPDPHDDAKLALLERCRQQAQADPERDVFLSLDEFGYYRQPSLARDYDAWGPVQPLARRSYRSNTCYRGLAALNAITGQVLYTQARHVGRVQLVRFWHKLVAAYPQAAQIFIALDNWPVHFHPDVLAPLQPQNFPWPPTLPPTWPTEPTAKFESLDLPIHLLCLPTYASWLNPVEKLWRWVRQKVIHLHRYADEWDTLKQRVAAFFEPFRHGSTEVLRYVGLLPN